MATALSANVTNLQRLAEEVRALDHEATNAMDFIVGGRHRGQLENMTTEARILLDRAFGPLNTFSTALLSVPKKPTDLEDLLERAIRLASTADEKSTSITELLATAAVARLPTERSQTRATPNPTQYVSKVSISALKRLQDAGQRWDLRRLICLCEELNVAYTNNCALSVGMLLRAIKDHCPPIFNKGNFHQVANNVAMSQSHMALFGRLDQSLTRIADVFLHQQIRVKDSLPTMTQVGFQAELDALLAEIEVALSK